MTRIEPSGKTVLITGASTGLGRATALHLAERGFRVLGAVRKAEDGERLVADCPSGRAEHVVLDVTDEASIAVAAETPSPKLPSEQTTISTGTSSHGMRSGAPPGRFCPSSSKIAPSRAFVSRSRTTMKRHGCTLRALGAFVAASIMRSISASSTGSGVKCRIARWV